MRLFTFYTLKARITGGMLDGVEATRREEIFQKQVGTMSWLQIVISIVSIAAVCYLAVRLDAKYRLGTHEALPNCGILIMATSSVAAFEAIARDRAKRAYETRYSELKTHTA